MRLETMAADRRPAVIGDRDRQEMILDIRPFDAGSRPDEGCRLELVGGAQALLEEQPLRADHAHPEPVVLRMQRDRQLRLELVVIFQVVLQVLPDARTVSASARRTSLALLARTSTIRLP